MKPLCDLSIHPSIHPSSIHPSIYFMLLHIANITTPVLWHNRRAGL
jgi:hypothetical protein